MSRSRAAFSIIAFFAGCLLPLITITGSNRNDFGLRLRLPGESSTAYIRREMDVCRGHTARLERCLTVLSDILMHQYTITEILRLFHDTEKYEEVFTFCHEATHFLGQTLYRQTRKKQQAFGNCTEVCGAGCYHGVLEGYLKEKRGEKRVDDKLLARDLSAFCGSPKDYEKPLVYNECIHGLGHGLMYLTNRDLSRSLTMCDEVNNAPLCYKGAFMENSFWVGGPDREGKEQPPRTFRPENPLAPCDTIGEKYRWECYGEKAADFGSQVDWDTALFLTRCEGLIPQKYREQCYRHLGAQQGLLTQDVVRMNNACSKVTQETDRQLCVEAAVTTLGDRYPKDPTLILAFCRTVGPETKEICYRQLYGYLDNWGETGDTTTVCRWIGEEKVYAPWCKQ